MQPCSRAQALLRRDRRQQVATSGPARISDLQALASQIATTSAKATRGKRHMQTSQASWKKKASLNRMRARRRPTKQMSKEKTSSRKIKSVSMRARKVIIVEVSSRNKDMAPKMTTETQVLENQRARSLI